VLAYQASALVDHQHGLVVNGVVSSPCGRGEVHDARCPLQGIAGVAPRATVSADKGYDSPDWVEGARPVSFTP
jgi:hypothetical protein